MRLRQTVSKPTRNTASKRAPGTARRDLPDPASITSERTIVSPKGNRYRIIETDEQDAYDPADKPRREDR